MVKERNQNPTVGDTIRLRLVAYNNKNSRDISSFNGVEIYYLDPNECSATNTDGRTLIETIEAGDIVREDEGMYYIDLATPAPQYIIGKYIDNWLVKFEALDNFVSVDNRFDIYPDLWYTTTTPAVYSFGFSFQPNKIRQGSFKYLIIQIHPNVPHATDLERYYTNLAIAADLKISISKKCGPCVQPEDDLNLIIDEEDVTIRDKCFGFYKLDTRELDCGIYDVWFKLEFADSIEISSKMNLQVY